MIPRRLFIAAKISGAIVLISLLALLLIGPRHGHDLVKNAKITSLVSALAYTRNSITGFFKEYYYLPGDLPDPIKIPSCANKKCWVGNGDGIIQNNEATHFFDHLAAADLSDKMIENIFSLGKNIVPLYHTGDNSLPFSYRTTPHEKGHYLALIGNSTIDETSVFLTSKEAMLIDIKLDDGLPDSGFVTAAGEKNCVKTNKDGLKLYNTKHQKICLFIYMKLNVDPS